MPRTSLSSRIFLSSVCVFVCIAALHPASAAKIHRAPRQVRQQIDDLEEQWRTATLNADVPVMDRLLSDDYVGISWTGQVNTKATQLDRVRQRTLVVTRMDLSDIKVKLLGPVAVVTCAAAIEGTNDGGPMTGTFRYTRVYQRLPNGAWKITSFEATRVPNHQRNAAPASSPPNP